MILPNWLAAALGAVLGAIIGSFLATVAIRWPKGESAARGRSRCDDCGRTLGWWELVPLVSAVMLRGKCRTCGANIDSTHVLIELAAAALGAAALGLSFGIEGAGWAILGWILLLLAILDWRHFWLPDKLTLPLAFLGLTLGLWVNDVPMFDRVIGAAAGYGLLVGIELGYQALRGRAGLGRGDAKLFGALGAWLGWQALPFLLLFASVLGLVVALVSLTMGGKVGRMTRVPLGTFLCLAALPAWMAVLHVRPG